MSAVLKVATTLFKKVYLSRYTKLKIDSTSGYFMNSHNISFISSKFNEICKTNRYDFVPPITIGYFIAEYSDRVNHFFSDFLRADHGLNIIQVFEVLYWHPEILNKRTRNIFKTDNGLYVLAVWSGTGWYLDLFSEKWAVSRGDKVFGCARA